MTGVKACELLSYGHPDVFQLLRNIFTTIHGPDRNKEKSKSCWSMDC